MSDTPKSFEEWWSAKNLPLDCLAALDARDGWDAHAYWYSLAPQAAAVPARQDAAPEDPEEEKCFMCHYPDHEAGCIEAAKIRGVPLGAQTAVEPDDFDEAGIRPNVTEGGVGERLMDLVRHQRNELHEEGLITDDEFAALVVDNEGGQRVARLEGYDAILRQRDAAIAQRDELERKGKSLCQALGTALMAISERDAKLAAVADFKPGEIEMLLRESGAVLSDLVPLIPAKHREELIELIGRNEAALRRPGGSV